MSGYGMSNGCNCCGCVIFDINPGQQTLDESNEQLDRWDINFTGMQFMFNGLSDIGHFIIPGEADIVSLSPLLPKDFYRIQIDFFQFGELRNTIPPEFKISIFQKAPSGETLSEGLMWFTNEHNATPYILDPNEFVENALEWDVSLWQRVPKNHRIQLFSHVPDESENAEPLVTAYSKFQTWFFDIEVFDDTIQFPRDRLGNSQSRELDGDDGNVQLESLTRKRYATEKCFLRFENLTTTPIIVRRMLVTKIDREGVLPKCGARPKVNSPNIRNAPLAIESSFSNGPETTIFTSGRDAEARATPYPPHQVFQLPDLRQEGDEYVLEDAPDCNNGVKYYVHRSRYQQDSITMSPTIQDRHRTVIDPLYIIPGNGITADKMVVKVTLDYIYFSNAEGRTSWPAGRYLPLEDVRTSRRFAFDAGAGLWRWVWGGIVTNQPPGSCGFLEGDRPIFATGSNVFGPTMPTPQDALFGTTGLFFRRWDGFKFRIPLFPPEFQWTAENPENTAIGIYDPLGIILYFQYLIETHNIVAEWTIEMDPWDPGEFPGFTIPLDAEAGDEIGNIKIITAPTVVSPPQKVTSYTVTLNNGDLSASQTLAEPFVGSLVVRHRGDFYAEEL
jgi:hypothetical protein